MSIENSDAMILRSRQNSLVKQENERTWWNNIRFLCTPNEKVEDNLCDKF